MFCPRLSLEIVFYFYLALGPFKFNVFDNFSNSTVFNTILT